MQAQRNPFRCRILAHRSCFAKQGALPAGLAAVLLTVVLTGCSHEEPPLHLADLGPGELQYVTRIVTLERAKAVTLADAKRGGALLDSLAVAWGDSSLEKTAAGVPLEPGRARRLNELLERILAAEKDSLITAPRPDRLRAPLPDV